VPPFSQVLWFKLPPTIRLVLCRLQIIRLDLLPNTPVRPPTNHRMGNLTSPAPSQKVREVETRTFTRLSHCRSYSLNSSPRPQVPLHHRHLILPPMAVGVLPSQTNGINGQASKVVLGSPLSTPTSVLPLHGKPESSACLATCGTDMVSHQALPTAPSFGRSFHSVISTRSPISSSSLARCKAHTAVRLCTTV
jgi:hypothetical protein